jgi:SAM-dependent methyltransferase
MTPFIYRSRLLYNLIMSILYGVHVGRRHKLIADTIPDGVSVLDVCCGPCGLQRSLRKRTAIRYVGIDASGFFVESARRRGIEALLVDIRSEAIPRGFDWVVMQASLYQFHPDEKSLIERLLKASNSRVVIAEPIRNVSGSVLAPLAAVAAGLTAIGPGQEGFRFTEESLDACMGEYLKCIISKGYIPGGREKYFILDKNAQD